MAPRSVFVDTIPLGHLGRVMIRKRKWKGNQSRYHFMFDTGTVFHSLRSRYTRKQLRSIALGHYPCHQEYLEAYSMKPPSPRKDNDAQGT